MGLNKRIDVLDYLRGFALLGIILVNIGPLLSVEEPSQNSMDASYWRFLYLFVEGRFYTIFTFLFGVGFYIFITRANAKGMNGYVLFLRRIAVLFLFGLIHVRFHPGEALTVYAVCGLILLPFYKINKAVNLIIGFGLLVIIGISAIKILMVVPVMLLGISAGQFGLFEVVTKRVNQIAVFTMIMFGLSAIGLLYQYQYAPVFSEGWSGPSGREAARFIDIGITIGPIVSAFYAGLLVLLLQIQIIQKLLSPLKSYGRMALTNYLLQTVFIYLAGYTFNLFGRVSYIETLYICLAIYVIQMTVSVIWLRFFRYGPLEWIWRALTYLKVPSMR
ncbi:DUF418 domain-containing protein [Neobacillus rhizophilus]|uniref:DUF418 domain-containing protein n=1 Tax=Neobacillus rhizophilus TaxID=2833579 RepID=A0A942YXS6_9BACI|nr:DUF418 domain-containing protein [Neobacillus rhizophilus]MBS4216314.1 DUF418 domain-containing protein [Neobacillus rhizophilus]